MNKVILYDQHNKPMITERDIMQKFQRQLRAKYDGAQTATGNEKHWSAADLRSPDQSSSPEVRRKLRSRSRYELIENNPYLKGTLLTVCNDFVGSGPKLKIADTSYSESQRIKIEQLFKKWCSDNKLRKILWRMRMQKIVDGESFQVAYTNLRSKNPVKLSYFTAEPEQVTSPNTKPTKYNEFDGVRFDNYDNILSYHIADSYVGNYSSSYGSTGRGFTNLSPVAEGKWVDASNVLHWFRQDRNWKRGIPELASSLPLCALLRRYTLAVVEHKETAANMTAILESQLPANTQFNPDEDEPFDIIPIERGMFMTLPWSYTMKQLDAVPDGISYDEFVGAILREITRPALTPFNLVAGTSKDSNMASGVLDQHIYKEGQRHERKNCEEDILSLIFDAWWSEARLLPGFLPTRIPLPPEISWRWDKIAVDHTDPAKVASALATLRSNEFLTDEDIQETYFNRTVEEWREQVLEDHKFRTDNDLPLPDAVNAAAASGPSVDNPVSKDQPTKQANQQDRKANN